MDDERPYTIEMEVRDGYLYVLVSGKKLTANIAAKYWNEIAEKCFESDNRKILIEKNFKETASVEELLSMADHLGSLLPNHWVAFVDRFRHDNINELGKRLARNRNVMMQIFPDTVEAARWLHAN